MSWLQLATDLGLTDDLGRFETQVLDIGFRTTREVLRFANQPGHSSCRLRRPTGTGSRSSFTSIIATDGVELPPLTSGKSIRRARHLSTSPDTGGRSPPDTATHSQDRSVARSACDATGFTREPGAAALPTGALAQAEPPRESEGPRPRTARRAGSRSADRRSST